MQCCWKEQVSYLNHLKYFRSSFLIHKLERSCLGWMASLSWAWVYCAVCDSMNFRAAWWDEVTLVSVCVSETMTVMQFKGNIGWSQGKDREREILSGSEWRGNRGGEVGKKTMKRHRRMNMTSSDSPESQWGFLKSKYTVYTFCQYSLRTLQNISILNHYTPTSESEVSFKTHLWCDYQHVILWLAWIMQAFSA